jgi:hypothetical protein
MTFVDALAIVLIVASGGAFIAGEVALSRAEDLRAIYWLTIGVVSLRAAVQITRPGTRE